MDPVQTVEIYKDEAEEWRWRAKSADGDIVATSGEGYEHPSGPSTSTRMYPEAEIVEV